MRLHRNAVVLTTVIAGIIQIIMCENHILEKESFENTVTHELVSFVENEGTPLFSSYQRHFVDRSMLMTCAVPR
jgi:hypothetical protein